MLEATGTILFMDHKYCTQPLAPYASLPHESRGRLHEEDESAHRSPFQRDRDRIIHSSAFRRLKYKTQVFVHHEADHYRTRLSHTLEVAQIARTIARALNAHEDLAEAVALAHDLGHSAFAHAGEDELVEKMQGLGGFDHNDQSLRVVTLLEKKYIQWDGLNLTWETLEGIIKHNGPLTDRALPVTLAAIQNETDFELHGYASLEAQIAGLADDIAYNNHDVEDGINAGLFDVSDIAQLTLFKNYHAQIIAEYPNLEKRRMVFELVRELIGAMVTDVLRQTKINLDALAPQSANDIRNAGRPMVEFSPLMLDNLGELRDFLFERMYKHPDVLRMCYGARRKMGAMFDAFMSETRLLPLEWQAEIKDNADDIETARVVCDYLASMTDRKALVEYDNIFS